LDPYDSFNDNEALIDADNQFVPWEWGGEKRLLIWQELIDKEN
jgi:hypothetical protein